MRGPSPRAGFRASGFRREPDEPDGGSPLRGFRSTVTEKVPVTPTESPTPLDGGGETPPPHQRFSGSGARWAFSAAAVLLVAIVVIALLAFKLGSQSNSTASSATPTPTTATSTTASTLPVTDVYKQVVPSVVLIETSKGALGSGVIVNSTGTIVTADHVVSGGGTIAIVFSDGTKSVATVASADKTTDIATLTPQTLPEVVVPATLGGAVAVGADVVAIGNPLALQDSTTSGVVSGLDRSAKTDAGQLSGLIQFDAAVNPGSSGGPLLNNQGSVVGIVLSIADPGQDDAFAGIGFAEPIAAALSGGDTGNGPGGGPQI